VHVPYDIPTEFVTIGSFCEPGAGQRLAKWYIVYTSAYTPKGEHSYLLRNLLGRVSMFAETYRIDGLQTEASLQNLNIAGCTHSLAIERLRTPPNPKIAGY